MEECRQETSRRSFPEAFTHTPSSGPRGAWLGKSRVAPTERPNGVTVDSSCEYGYDLSLNWKQTEALRGWVTALGALSEHQGPSKAPRFRAVTVSPEPSQGWAPFGSFCLPGGASRSSHPVFVVTSLLVLKSAHQNPVKTAIPQRALPIDSLAQWRVLLGPGYPREKPQSWQQQYRLPKESLPCGDADASEEPTTLGA